MELMCIIIAAVVALLIGCVITWSFMRSKVSALTSEQTIIDSKEVSLPGVTELEQQLKIAIASKEQALSLKEELELKISKMEIQLKQKETQLINLNSKIDEISAIPSDAKEGKLIESLKNDLKKKSDEVESKDEEIEDLEDEISSLKKKLKSAKSEVEDLTAKISEHEKKCKKLESELNDKESELEDLKKEDAVKAEAIEFVNAVLQAKDADDRDAKTINEKVGKIKSIIYDEFIPLQRQYFSNIDDWINQVYAITIHWANLQSKSWLKRKKVIAFIGEFSAGKTSIVNRILSQDDPDCPRLPVSSKATTAIATYISYGEGFNSQFTDANGNLKNLPPEMFTKVNKDILAKVNVSSIIQYFVMKYKNENLRGLSILDTPGFSSNDDQDKERTLAVINEADALFWVLDANSGEVNRTSLKIIADSVQDIPLYVVINKADTKAPNELDKLESHIRDTMTRAEINVTGYVRFSQKSPLVDIMNVIESLPEARTGLDIGRICHDLKRELGSLQNDLDTCKKNLRELKGLLDNREEILKEDIDDVAEACQSISSIPRYNSRWLRKDDYRMDQDEYQELNGLCEGVQGASEQVKECFNDYKDFISQYHQKLKEQTETKEQFASTKKVYSHLMNAIKVLDPKLHQEIEQAVKETIEADTKEKSQNGKYSGSSHNQNNGLSNSGLQTTSQQELEKADCFYNRGSIEEAKFWYRKSAQHGNKQAKKMCRQLGITF